MGKMGQPTDRNSMEEKRNIAVRLLNQGIAPSAVRQQLRVSKTWIYKVRQESMNQTTAWDGVERRLGLDRRIDPSRKLNGGSDRRSGKDRRSAAG